MIVDHDLIEAARSARVRELIGAGRIPEAEQMYGCRGFVAHHNTDLWRDCAPQDIYIPSIYWVMGAAWLCPPTLWS